MGNLGSIKNMLSFLGYNSIISDQKKDIDNSDFLILPGVGKFDHAMENIKKLNLEEVIKKNVLDKKIPILGICLGMQLMCLKSEEGTKNGLSLIDYEVKKFKFDEKNNLKVPHMGWNFLKNTSHSTLFKGINGNLRYYFVHSYFVEDSNNPFKSSLTEYGINFVSSFDDLNILRINNGWILIHFIL